MAILFLRWAGMLTRRSSGSTKFSLTRASESGSATSGTLNDPSARMISSMRGRIAASSSGTSRMERHRSLPLHLSWAPAMKRWTGALGVMAPPVAAAAVVIAGWLTPGYDPLARTISRLAEPSLPGAFLAEAAIAIVGVALIAIAIELGPGSGAGRALLAVAGAGPLAAGGVRLDPTSASATAEHRLATTVAMLGLTGAPLAFASSLRRRAGWVAYGPISFAFGAAEVAVLLVGLALLPTTFAEWGVWERCFLALPMAWIVLLSARVLSARKIEPMFSSTADRSSWPTNVSADDTMNAAAASQSRSGS